MVNESSQSSEKTVQPQEGEKSELQESTEEADDETVKEKESEEASADELSEEQSIEALQSSSLSLQTWGETMEFGTPQKHKIFTFDDEELINQSFVNLMSGAAEIRLPLVVPEGIGGLTPDVTLSYSSQLVHQNSPFGYGWEVELGHIKRMNKTGVVDMYDDPVYHISLGSLQGELIQTGTSGSIEEYRLRREQEFAKIDYDTSNDAWTVIMKNGVVYRLGKTSQSRFQDSSGDKVFSWHLEEVEELHGNKIEYSYRRIGQALYPKTIEYGAPGAGTHPFEIRFLPMTEVSTPSSNRDDYRLSYSSGFAVEYEHLITSIEIYSDGTKRLEYDFSYESNSIKSRSDLKELTITGTNGSEVDTQSIDFAHYSLEDGESPENIFHRNDFLKSMTFHQGGVITYDYTPSTQLFNDMGDLANQRPHYPLFVVSSVTRSDFTGRSDETTYHYSDGYFYYESVVERELAGFGITTVTDPLGQTTQYYFHQGGGYDGASIGENSDHWSLIGQLYRTELYDDQDRLIQRQITRWESSSLGTKRYFIRPEKEVSTTFNTSSQGRSVAVEKTYDSNNGNLTEELEYGEVSASDNGTFTDVGNDDRKLVISYASNSTDHILSYPKNQKLYDENNILVSEVSFLYDDLSSGSISEGDATDQIQEFFEETRQITTQREYNSAGLITKHIDARSNETSISYDSFTLYPASVTNDLSHVTSYDYDITFGQVTEVTDPNSLITQSSYDGLGRLIKQEMTDPADSDQLTTMQEVVYQESSTPHSVLTKAFIDATTTADDYRYLDGFGRTIQARTEDASGDYIVSNTVYDALGRVTEQTLPIFVAGTSYNWSDASTTKTSTSYDVLSRPTQVQDANGTTSMSYDRWDRTVNDANGNDKTFKNDAYGRMITVVEEEDTNTYTTSYEYDVRDLITKLTDADGNVRNFDYDSLGRLIEQEDLHDSSDSSFGTWEYVYDDVSNVTKVTNPKAQEIDFTYDDLNRLTNEQLSGQSSTAFTYTYDTGTNQKGRLTSVVGPDHSWSANYDKRGRVTSELNVIDSTNYTKSYTYSRFDAPLTVTMPDSTVLTYSYNGIGQIDDLISNHGDILDSVSYSPISQVKAFDFANGLVSTMTYDPNKMYRMTSKLTENDAQTTTYQDIAYTFDNVGNITNLVEASGSSANKTAVYVYDDLYRLTSATITNTTTGGNYTRTLTYSGIGNILSKSDQGDYTYAEPGKTNPHAVTLIEGDFGFGYGYGGTGNDTKEYTYDDNGNMTQELITVDGGPTITKNLSWDHNNRMTQTTVSDGTNTTTVTYTYDQSGRRLKKVVDDGTTTATTRYPYPDYEVTTSGSTKTTVNADAQHVATIEDDGVDQTIYFHHDDHLGGANIVTDAAGTLVQVIDYYPFGSLRVDDQSASYDSTQKFTGHEFDDSTELYYAQARYYNSEIGRFVSQDPLQWRVGELMERFKEKPQALNYYSYVVNNPIILIDPKGEFAPLIEFLVNPVPTAKAPATQEEAASMPDYAPSLSESVVSDIRSFAADQGFNSAASFLGVAISILGVAKDVKDITKGRVPSIKEQASDLKKLNINNKNRVEINTPSGPYRYDLEGKSHFNKETGDRIETPHVQEPSKIHTNPSDPSKNSVEFTEPRPMNQEDVRNVRNYLDRN